MRTWRFYWDTLFFYLYEKAISRVFANVDGLSDVFITTKGPAVAASPIVDVCAMSGVVTC